MFTERTSKILLWSGIGLLAIGTVIFFWKESLTPNEPINAEKIGQFGDFIGGLVGAVWSLGGIILFYVALREQRIDLRTNQRTLKAQTEALKQQIREFELQREEIQETRTVFKEQSETLRSQRFENTLFQLVNLYHQIIEKLHYEEHHLLDGIGRNVYSQREALNAANARLGVRIRLSQREEINTENGSKPKEIEFKEIEVVNMDHADELFQKAYWEFYFVDTSQLLSHYFRSVYHIFKFIHLSDLIPPEKKQFYASIVRAQLSSDELNLSLQSRRSASLILSKHRQIH